MNHSRLRTLRTFRPLLLAFCLAWLWVVPRAAADPPVVLDTPVVAPAPVSDIESQTVAFFARYRAIAATATRIGNSSNGTTEATKVFGATTFPDGAPLRLAIPWIVNRVAMEKSPDGKSILLRLDSPWNEGGWHTTYITPEGKIVGGWFDFPFPLTDRSLKTDENAWQYGTGAWLIGAWGDPAKTPSSYKDNLPFTELKQGEGSGVPGYSWKSDDGGFVLTTPKTRVYGLVPIETVAADPADPGLLFSLYNSFTVNWSGVGGNGKEQKTFSPSFDYEKYPTDPRRNPAPITHPGVLGTARVGGELYVFTGANQVMIHRWDAATKLLVPVAAIYVGPGELPANVPGVPTLVWGQGAVVRAGIDDNLAADRWEVFSTSILAQRGSSYLKTIDSAGNLYLMPQWSKVEDANPVTLWRLFDPVRGVASLDNVRTLPLPDALRTAPSCAQTRLDEKTSDLYAVVMRSGAWNLERYPGWKSAANPAAILPAYSVGPVALSLRSDYNSFAPWNEKWGCSKTDAGVMSAAFGSMAVCGGYAFIAEAQAGGVRIYRLSDGSVVGRVSDRLHVDSTIDDPTQIQVTETSTEFRVFLMDFNGKQTLVWRITKKALGKL